MTWNVGFVIQDGSGQSSRLSMHLNDALSRDEVVAAAQAIATLLDPLTEGAIVSIGAVLGVALPGGLGAADPKSNVEEGARFIWSCGTLTDATFRIPTFPKTKTVDGADVVNLADASVIALRDGLIIGVATGGLPAQLNNYLGEDVIALSSAVKASQRQRR